MKIAMVSEHADPTAALGGADAGGQNVHVGALATALAGRGHSVTVYTRLTDLTAPRTVELGPGVTVRRLKAGPVTPLAKDELLPHMPELGRRLAQLWRPDPPDVVHAHFWMSGLATLHAVTGLDIPVVQTSHALGAVKARHQGAADPSPPGRVGAERRIAAACDQVVATCSDEASELAALGVPPWQVSVVPCGVDVEAFRPDGPVARRTGRPRLLALGRLVERKGVTTAIAALAELPEAELIVAGGPDPAALDSDPGYQAVRAAAARHRVADRVVCTGGVARADVPALIRSADAVVCVPWYEPFGIVPLEAMACGGPGGGQRGRRPDRHRGRPGHGLGWCHRVIRWCWPARCGRCWPIRPGARPWVPPAGNGPSSGTAGPGWRRRPKRSTSSCGREPGRRR